MPAKEDTGEAPWHCHYLRQGPHGNYLKCERFCKEVEPGVGSCKPGCGSYRASDRQAGDKIPLVEQAPTGQAAGLEELWEREAEEVVLIKCLSGMTVDRWLLVCHDCGMRLEAMIEALDPGVSVSIADIERRLRILLGRRERIRAAAKRAGVHIPELEGVSPPSAPRRVALAGAEKGEGAMSIEGWPQPRGELGSLFGCDIRGRAVVPWNASAEDVYLKLAEVYGAENLPSELFEPEPGEGFHAWAKRLQVPKARLAALVRVSEASLSNGLNRDTPPQQLKVAEGVSSAAAKPRAASVWQSPAQEVLAGVNVPGGWPEPTSGETFEHWALRVYMTMEEGSAAQLAGQLVVAGRFQQPYSFTTTLRGKVVRRFGNEACPGMMTMEAFNQAMPLTAPVAGPVPPRPPAAPRPAAASVPLLPTAASRSGPEPTSEPAAPADEPAETAIIPAPAPAASLSVAGQPVTVIDLGGLRLQVGAVVTPDQARRFVESFGLELAVAVHERGVQLGVEIGRQHPVSASDVPDE